MWGEKSAENRKKSAHASGTCSIIRSHVRLLNPFLKAKRRAELAETCSARASSTRKQSEQKISLYEMPPEIYDEYMSTQMEERNFEEVFRRVRKAAGEKTRILDLCCGTGIFLRKWLSRLENVSYVGVDINRPFLEFAIKNSKGMKNCRFVKGDAVEVRLNEEFDRVLATSAYHHIPDEKKVDFLRNVARHLKRSGVGVIYEKLVAPFNDAVSRVISGTSFYFERILNVMREQELSEMQLFALFNELYLTSVRKEEYKVTFERLMNELQEAGLVVLDEVKLWPADDRFQNPKVGDFAVTFRKR